MSTIPLPRATQRQLKRLTLKNEPTIAADARFFERRPERSHRLRLSSVAEVEILRLLRPGNPLTPGLRWYTAVRQVRKGFRMRVFSMGLPHLDCDESEEVSCWVFERNRNARDVETEASLRQIAETLS